MAARLKALGMDSLIIDQSAEVGDVWKKRYEYLSLHFPHWADDLPYFPYPKHWPTYTPSQKQGVYMEWYASALELNVWCKSCIRRKRTDVASRPQIVTPLMRRRYPVAFHSELERAHDLPPA